MTRPELERVFTELGHMLREHGNQFPIWALAGLDDDDVIDMLERCAKETKGHAEALSLAFTFGLQVGQRNNP